MNYNQLLPNLELELRKANIIRYRINKINNIFNIYKSKQDKE